MFFTGRQLKKYGAVDMLSGFFEKKKKNYFSQLVFISKIK